VEVSVFTTILGVPAHPLLIHATVVFVPLLIVGAVVYALWPRVRARIDWAVAGLAIVAPLSAWFSRVSGEHLRQRLIDRRLASPQILAKIAQHESFGDKTLWWALALAVIALVMIGHTRARRGPVPTPLRVAFAVVTLVAAGFAAYYVFKTGDTGAHIVWAGF
jgi:hypothetical protein